MSCTGSRHEHSPEGRCGRDDMTSEDRMLQMLPAMKHLQHDRRVTAFTRQFETRSIRDDREGDP